MWLYQQITTFCYLVEFQLILRPCYPKTAEKQQLLQFQRHVIGLHEKIAKTQQAGNKPETTWKQARNRPEDRPEIERKRPEIFWKIAGN